MAKIKVLVASPVYQKPSILQHFLESLTRLDQFKIEYSYMFVDDNKETRSSELLREFKQANNNVTIMNSVHEADYVCDDRTHYWNEGLIWHVAGIKNMILDYGLALGYDYLFLVDSDIVLYPQTVDHLVSLGKDIISEIFWTKWQPEAGEQPQVWLSDEYIQWKQVRGEKLTDEDKSRRYDEFIRQMRMPGVYEVGGLGACTLISAHALRAGVNFKPIPNLSFWGEDRHFCIRAAALGLRLYVDTHYPAYHIYRESDLEGVPGYVSRTLSTQDHEQPASVSRAPQVITGTRPKLTLSMVVKNESGRYLEKVIAEHKKYVDEVVIIDDGSTDNTADICKEYFDGIPVHLVSNKLSKFSNEVELRKQQWKETISTNPEWILNLDADEMFETRFHMELPKLLGQTQTDVFCFRLYDFWNEDHYREDSFWRSHKTYRPFLLRYRPNFEYTWQETPQHCGRFPNNILKLTHALSDLRLKHFGWMSEEDRARKFDRYMKLDPQGKFGCLAQYLSIGDEHPHLVRWIEQL
ncbi:glycosyltransferase family 2 protein [Paenibacillus sp. YPG26]|uniref:glycosyltransferase n=1 Tax=Paenibacillus sp. YPG26 TaxID=2878915 RepID=UPI00203D465B|nr:glycosyltransferase family 2 protein [Paenibacillus sp. YPG26]USB34390.1 glycosyltransferase family 2 protein [Paenibacillus sp. YPG26]